MLKKLALGLLAGVAFCAPAQAWQERHADHVLLISVDGLHALDVARYAESHPSSAIAELTGHGLTYSNARTPANSDSFPGLLALVTGGSPVTTKLLYDVSYDRTIFDPANTTCSGQGGNTMVFDETIDKYSSANVSLNVIDPAKLPRYKDASGHCSPLYPHAALRTNTIFEAVKANGGRTAWADKHPAYDLVNGPSGKGVDDLYTPEITNANGTDATVSIDCTVANDQLKVKAILNQINGLTSDGKPASVPAVFGMNFQAVSVGQKLVSSKAGTNCPGVNAAHDGLAGGYLDGAGTPSAVLAFGLDQTDAALASMIKALKSRGIYDRTLIIVSAKHGQSPINPVKVNKPGHFADLVAKLPDAGTNPAAKIIADAAACSKGPCGFVQDDTIALLWLKDQSKAPLVADYLNKNAQALFIDEVMAGPSLKLKFGDPRLDARTPDIIVQPAYGTIYSASAKKNAEHGGFNFADTNVALIVSNPHLPSTVIKSPVASSQVAPTILKALGINPLSLNSVAIEHTPVLPGLMEERENASQPAGASSYQ